MHIQNAIAGECMLTEMFTVPLLKPVHKLLMKTGLNIVA